MQPCKKRQNHDCIFIMWKDKLHYLFLIKISPTTFASTFDPNPLMPSSSETIRISRSSFSSMRLLHDGRLSVHAFLEVMAYMKVHVLILQVGHCLSVAGQRHAFVGHLGRSLVTHVFGDAVCHIAVDHVRRYAQGV